LRKFEDKFVYHIFIHKPVKNIIIIATNFYITFLKCHCLQSFLNFFIFVKSVYFCPQHFNMIVAWRVMLYKIFHIMNCYGNEKGLFIRRNCII